MPTPIDTSGYVLTTSQFPPPGDGALKLGWSDLDPFTRGYTAPILEAVGAPFHRLASETLELILRDCAAMAARCMKPPTHGALFWQARNAKAYVSFPLLTPTLADDGFVYLREGR